MCAAVPARCGAHTRHTPGRAVRRSGPVRAWGSWRGAMTQQFQKCQVSSYLVPHTDDNSIHTVFIHVPGREHGDSCSADFCVTRRDDIPGRAP